MTTLCEKCDNIVTGPVRDAFVVRVSYLRDVKTLKRFTFVIVENYPFVIYTRIKRCFKVLYLL